MLRPKPYNTKRWLSSKPYRKPTAYDEEMAQVGRKLEADFKSLSSVWTMIEVDSMTRQELINTALGYLEDQVSQVGFWRAFTLRNEELIGKPLPFWDLDSYEPDQVNLADFKYLAWHFLNTWTDKIWAPDGEPVLLIAQVLFDRLADAYEYVSETDYYEKYLSIEPEADFLDIKLKLAWWARGGYLLSSEFGQDIIQDVLSAQEDNPDLTQTVEVSTLAYLMQDPYLYLKRSSYAAMTVPEWMARVIRGSDEVKASLLAMKAYFNGKFRYEGTDESHHHFVHITTGRSYQFDMKDFPLDQSEIERGQFMQFPLVPWQGQWYMSGLATGVPPEEMDTQASASGRTHYKYASETQQAKMRENLMLMERAFRETFGQLVVLFESKEAASQKMQQFITRHYQMIWDNIPPDKRPQNPPPVPNANAYAEESDSRGRLGVAMIRGEGIQVLPQLYELVDLLRQEEPLPLETSQLVFWRWLGEGYPPIVTQYLLDHEPTHQLKLPMRSQVDWLSEVPFMQRYFFPQSFNEPTPEIFMVESEMD